MMKKIEKRIEKNIHQIYIIIRKKKRIKKQTNLKIFKIGKKI